MIIFYIKQLRLLLGILSILFCCSVVADSVQKPAVLSALSSNFLLTGSANLKGDAGYIAVGLYGHVIKSRSGVSWKQEVSPVQALLTNVFFLTSKVGWAVGHDAVILHTVDGGAHWQLQYENPIPNGDLPKPLLDVYFSDADYGVAVGAYGLILETNDGGEHWSIIQTDSLYDKLEELEMEPEPNFNSVSPLGRKLIIAGELGSLLIYDPEATDEVTRWQVLSSPYEGTFFGSKVFDKTGIYIYGLRGNIYNSKDLGESWVKIETGVVTSIYDCIELANGNIVFVGSDGTILTLDPVENATKKQLYAGFDTFMSVEESKTNDLLLFGTKGVKRVSIEAAKL